MTALVTPAWVRMMADYNAEMNRRLYAAAARLDDAERRRERGAFWGSIHGTFSHLLWADRIWMWRIDGWQKPAVPLKQSGAMEPDFGALAAARAQADAGLSDWAARVDAAWLAGELAWYSSAMQRDVVRPRAMVVTHLFNHQTHHRGQAHALLTQSGQQTDDTDLLYVVDAPVDGPSEPAAQPSARGTQGMRETSTPSSASASACSGVASP